MGLKRGVDCKLYYSTTGVAGEGSEGPTWVELTHVKNVSVPDARGEADVTTRASDFKLSAATLRELSIEFDMPWDTTDPGFIAFQTAYNSLAPIGIAAMDGDIETAGSQGFWADMAVIEFSHDENLEDYLAAKVVLKPTYSETAPAWATIQAES
jgi:hypothetical protein